MDTLFAALIFGFIIVLVIILKPKERTNNALRIAYEEALKGSDKRAALLAGRAYYGSIRKDGKLTIYDEQALTNDLSTMDDKTHQ